MRRRPEPQLSRTTSAPRRPFRYAGPLLLFEDVSTPLSDWNTDDGAVHLRITLRYRWQEAPRWLVLEYSLFAEHPMLVHAARMAPAASVLEQKLLAEPELVVFSRHQKRRPLLAASARRGAQNDPLPPPR